MEGGREEERGGGVRMVWGRGREGEGWEGGKVCLVLFP